MRAKTSRGRASKGDTVGGVIAVAFAYGSQSSLVGGGGERGTVGKRKECDLLGGLERVTFYSSPNKCR